MRIPRLLWAPVLALAVTITGTACGAARDPAPSPAPTRPADPPPDAARAELAARAAAAKDLVAVSSYTLTAPERVDRTVLAVRTRNGDWRVDIPGGALGGAADVALAQVDGQLYHCVLGSLTAAQPAVPAGCAPVAELPPEADPRVQHIFAGWLDVFTDRAAAVAVTAVAAPAEGVSGDCFAVEPRSASLVAAVDGGVYCYLEDGTLTYAELASGTLRLADTATAPPLVDLPSPVVVRDPVPTAAPTPGPSPEPDPAGAASPTAPPAR